MEIQEMIRKHVAALISLSGKFDMWPRTLQNARDYADRLIIRMHPGSGISPEMIEEYTRINPDHLNVFEGKEGKEWNKWNWREELIQFYHKKEPNTHPIIVTPDEDEIFPIGPMLHDLNRLKSSKELLVLMFKYNAPLPTVDGRTVFGGKPYPRLPHCKAFKYKQDLTYKPYVGLCLPTPYSNTKPNGHIGHASTKINHYCMFTKKMEKQKLAFIKKHKLA